MGKELASLSLDTTKLIDDIVTRLLRQAASGGCANYRKLNTSFIRLAEVHSEAPKDRNDTFLSGQWCEPQTAPKWK